MRSVANLVKTQSMTTTVLTLTLTSSRRGILKDTYIIILFFYRNIFENARCACRNLTNKRFSSHNAIRYSWREHNSPSNMFMAEIIILNTLCILYTRVAYVAILNLQASACIVIPLCFSLSSCSIIVVLL